MSPGFATLAACWIVAQGRQAEPSLLSLPFTATKCCVVLVEPDRLTVLLAEALL